MDATCSSRGLMVLKGRLGVYLPNVAPPGPEWVSVKCASKAAYRCGVAGKELLNGLTLYVRRLGKPYLNSSMCIRLSSVALRSIQAELGIPDHFQGVEGCLPEIDGSIHIANQQVLVVMVIFRFRNHDKRVYYLVYDAKDASLYMIPCIPHDLEATFTLTPVPARPTGGQGHELALMARKFWPQRAERDRLCVCTPSTRVNPASDKGAQLAGPSSGPWATKVHSLPDLPLAFSADVMFSLEDKVFWADLRQGVAYTDLRNGAAAFIELPHGYWIDLKALPTYAQIEPANMSRTMGCIEGSVKFVCIIRSRH